MSSIDPVVHNYSRRKVMSEHAASIGIQPGDYAFNALSMKMHYEREGKTEQVAINELLARNNMTRKSVRKETAASERPTHRLL